MTRTTDTMRAVSAKVERMGSLSKSLIAIGVLGSTLVTGIIAYGDTRWAGASVGESVVDLKVIVLESRLEDIHYEIDVLTSQDAMTDPERRRLNRLREKARQYQRDLDEMR